MEKVVKMFKINYSLDWCYGVSINKIREDLDAIEKLGATHIEIEHGICYDSSYVDIEVLSERLETDEEFKIRVDEENDRKEDIKRRDLEYMEKIKLKYGI